MNETAHRRLRITMVAGSLYDITFAAVNLIAPQLGSALFEIPLPKGQVYLRFTGVFLIALALFYSSEVDAARNLGAPSPESPVLQ